MKKETIIFLRNHGVSEKDIEAAKMVERVLIGLDQMVFRDNHIKRLNLCTKPGHRKVAKYYLGRNDPSQYLIYVVGLAEEIRSISLGRCIFASKGRRWRVRKSPAVRLSMEDACLRIAVHEVRHRLQYESKVPQFSRSYAKKAYVKWRSKRVNNKSLLARVLNFCRHYFDIRTEDFQKAKRTNKFIAKETSRVEFDALVVEHFVANKIFLSPNLSLQDIAKIVMIRPLKLD